MKNAAGYFVIFMVPFAHAQTSRTAKSRENRGKGKFVVKVKKLIRLEHSFIT